MAGSGRRWPHRPPTAPSGSRARLTTSHQQCARPEPAPAGKGTSAPAQPAPGHHRRESAANIVSSGWGEAPLVIELAGSRYPEHSIVDHYDDELLAHAEWATTDSPNQPFLFQLPVAPDRLHKENVSGGSPYGFVLPDGCADGMFAAETTMPFVSYLRWVFSHGGFPAQTGSPEEWRIKRQLASDLLPL